MILPENINRRRAMWIEPTCHKLPYYLTEHLLFDCTHLYMSKYPNRYLDRNPIGRVYRRRFNLVGVPNPVSDFWSVIYLYYYEDFGNPNHSVYTVDMNSRNFTNHLKT